MKAYLIEPEQKTVTEVKHNGDYKEIYKLIGCSTFDVARVENNGDAIYVDDEGLLNLTDDTKFFTYEGYHSPLCGKGLMLGVNSSGDSISPILSLAQVKAKIRFHTLAQVRGIVNAQLTHNKFMKKQLRKILQTIGCKPEITTSICESQGWTLNKLKKILRKAARD